MKILAIGKNYVNDKSDIEASKNGQQIIFSKPESSLVKNNKDVEFPKFTNELVYEAELVLKIGKIGKNIKVEDALSYVSEIGIGIDYTAKDVLTNYRNVKGPWDLAKGFDGAAPISSFKPISNFKNANNINFDLKINGKKLQVGNTGLMIYNFAEIISYISTYMTLEPGDLIFTGTPAHGTGNTFKGDHIQASIEGELLLDYRIV
ncbi:fumarylacetoacetate hydrolase family protein [Lutibacter sp. TH_r2]|uniref:fumarylacetoacetate hydrolase family protein n=1 Tax=Lutibacter sp. TH_r2 TaxID=3082083 RepID=UPI002953C759|nr:fumarylacetoacetate hydrolase family protein [Lutibacter sp. TH_r2]MDV7188067.1 fumarylacetoacetate hydrolase family protein [Lutibacter sp. TH_r2]